jgi:rubredoxin
MDARCPDCGVSLEPVDFGMKDAYDPHVRTGEKKDGFLGTLGVEDSTPVDAVLCPECGLVRLYAQLED